jgi:hypothetical protein
MSATKTRDDQEEKRPRGRPMVGAPADAGGFRRVNLSLDDTSLAIAAHIHGNTSAAVRMALAYWAEQHPQPKARSKK